MKDGVGGTQPLFHTDHNVYILGAGFSRDAGLPLMQDFMATMRAAWGGSQVQNAIAKVMQFRLDAAKASERVPLNFDNIEDLFSLAYASAVNDSSLAHDFTFAIAETIAHKAPKAALKIPCILSSVSKDPQEFRTNEETHHSSAREYRIHLYDFYIQV